MEKSRIIALVSTALIAVLVVLMLSITYLHTVAKDNDRPKVEIDLVEEEYVDLFEPSLTSTQGEEEAASYLEETVKDQSQATPAAGTDTENVGNAGDPAPLVSSKEESDVKVKKDTPKPQAPAVDKKKLEEEIARREANNEVANAFRNATGKHNTENSDRDHGLSGEKTQNTASQGTTGNGHGSVGGGWIIPKYSPVRSTVTGSVNMVVKIDNTGRVISVTPNGGTPPAATDATVLAAIEREIRAHKFSRSSYNDAEGATAYITYTFK